MAYIKDIGKKCMEGIFLNMYSHKKLSDFSNLFERIEIAIVTLKTQGTNRYIRTPKAGMRGLDSFSFCVPLGLAEV